MSLTSTIDRTTLVDVCLGVTFATAYPHQCDVISFPVTVTGEFDLEMLFAALNRIHDTVDADVAALPWEWQRTARRRLDLMQAPSMSVGDYVELFSEDGRHLGQFAVASRGWTRVDA